MGIQKFYPGGTRDILVAEVGGVMTYFRYFCYVNLRNLKFSMGGGGILDPRTFLIHVYNLTVYKNYLLKSLFYIFFTFCCVCSCNWTILNFLFSIIPLLCIRPTYLICYWPTKAQVHILDLTALFLWIISHKINFLKS